MKSVLFIIAILPATLWAGPAEDLVGRLIADAWKPGNVTVEWTFSAKAPALLANSGVWTISEPRPYRMAGSLVLYLTGPAGRVAVSGFARVTGPSLTPRNTIAANSPLNPADCDLQQTDWTQLGAPAVTAEELTAGTLAARTLIPGRAITRKDLKRAPLVRAGQPVEMSCNDGGVVIRLSGRAMEEGMAGDTISVAVDLGKSRRFKGAVDKDGSVHLVR